MTKIRLTKSFSFETAHALYGYDGKCRNIHGHSYKLWVTIIGKPINDDTNPKNGMIIDFGDLKKIVNTQIINVFDHAIVINRNSPQKEIAQTLEKQSHKVIFADYQPTSENMILDFVEKISKSLSKDIALHSLKLQETETSFVEWYSADN